MDKFIDVTIMLLALVGVCALIGKWEKHEREKHDNKNYDIYEGEKDKDGNDVYEDS